MVKPSAAAMYSHTPEVDCESHIGQDLYTFYFPIEIGDFVVSMWSKTGSLFSVTLYENGTPLSRRDNRIGRLPWSSKLMRSWKEDVYSKPEIDQMVSDLHVIAQKPPTPVGTFVPRVYRSAHR
ncbi:hypothetical protein PROFUN_00194 [Planoprotostelium fungivorum]|uniref:Uncharacterized protein n=1 Tax=Planoprotostelium fungivorum TaxID=1890364 RepID=A0A2P6P0X0_9EUKA|nr:hypothetical protein PROFUN_00194 [Planoprotostelium fungivorum]